MPTAPSRPTPTSVLLQQPVLFVWACYLLLAPFYVFPAGVPQPGDALIFLLVPMAVIGWDGKFGRSTVRTLRPLLWFTLWACVVALVWALVLWRFGFNLFYPLFYIYNTAFFFAALVLYRRYGDAFLRLTVQVVLVTIVFQVIASFVMVGSSGRSRLFFHNPNQLGYYALLAGCVIALAQRRLGFGMVKTSFGLVGCAYLAMLSSSRSSAAGILFLLLLLVFSNPRVLLLAALVSLGITALDTPVDRSVQTFQRRVQENRAPQLSFWEQRGYDRIWNHKRHILLGAAEGSHWRWKATTKIGGAEIHSSAGTLLFCYGLPGVALFGLFLVRLLRGVRLRTGLLLFPPLFYSLAHQGLRFTTLWVLFALFLALKDPAPRAR